MTRPRGRDRLRELLDAVLDEDHTSLAEMADGAYSSPYHLTRRLARDAGEPAVAMRRRVMLERAAWRLREGASVTDAAFEAGYESVEGFSRAFTRAFGHVPSRRRAEASTWLPAPNGIHFHPPTSLWVRSGEHTMSGPLDHLVHHDLDDTRALLEVAKGVPEELLREPRRPGAVVLSFDGEEASAARVLERLVLTKEVWLAAVLGEELSEDGDDGPAQLLERHDRVAGRWLAMVQDTERRGGWDDRIVDALCDPPESFVLGSILAHVLTFSAHRRQVARELLRECGAEVDGGDPIEWWRERSR